MEFGTVAESTVVVGKNSKACQPEQPEKKFDNEDSDPRQTEGKEMSDKAQSGNKGDDGCEQNKVVIAPVEAVVQVYNED